MNRSASEVAEVAKGIRRYSSPQRVLARSFRLSRDQWKQKHQAVQGELEQVRQLAAERGASRDLWRQRCEAAVARAEAAEARAAQQSMAGEQAQLRIAELEAALPKKTR